MPSFVSTVRFNCDSLSAFMLCPNLLALNTGRAHNRAYVPLIMIYPCYMTYYYHTRPITIDRYVLLAVTTPLPHLSILLTISTEDIHVVGPTHVWQ